MPRGVSDGLCFGQGEGDYAAVGAAALDALRAADFPYTHRVDMLAEMVAFALNRWPELNESDARA